MLIGGVVYFNKQFCKLLELLVTKGQHNVSLKFVQIGCYCCSFALEREKKKKKKINTSPSPSRVADIRRLRSNAFLALLFHGLVSRLLQLGVWRCLSLLLQKAFRGGLFDVPNLLALSLPAGLKF